jgi:hypothetical protein
MWSGKRNTQQQGFLLFALEACMQHIGGRPQTTGLSDQDRVLINLTLLVINVASF